MGITRDEIRQTSGENNSIVQAFYGNIFIDYKGFDSEINSWEIPQFGTIGGVNSDLYYQQSAYAIFTNMARPFVRFDFTDNTDSFGPDTTIIHDIYKIDFETFSGYRTGLTKDGFDSVKRNIKTTQKKTTFIDENGIEKITTEKTEIDESDSEQNYLNDKTTTLEELQRKLDEPIISLTAQTTGITTNIYDLVLEEEYKNLGGFSEIIFEDRSQYFIDTRFRFKNTRILYGDYNEFVNGVASPVSVDSEFYLETDNERHVITGSSYSGISVVGNYFTYFMVPDKPKLAYPIPEGSIDTFTPEFFWKNGEGADAYLFQISYNTGDTGFTGTVFSYPVEKNIDSLQEAVNRTKGPETEFTTSEKIRKFQLPLKSNKCFRYRVGNVKEIVDLFGVKRTIFTFSDSHVACTAFEPVKTFVKTRSDSPYLEEVPSLETPPSLESESPLSEYTLSGMVTGSVISYAEVQLHYPNGSFVTSQTDAVGYFEFPELEEGSYTLITRYRGYQDNTKSITIDSDKYITVELKLLWGNEFDTWGDKANDIPF
jgi:hypothetical protein